MDEIAAALSEVASLVPSCAFLLPLHPNPIVRRSFARQTLPDNVLVVEPLPYASFIVALERCDLVLTDSGGVLEEATVLGKPVLIARERTERPEAVAVGAAEVVGVGRGGIVAALTGALKRPLREPDALAGSVFGDGRSGERTIEWLRWRFGLTVGRPEPFTQEPAVPPTVSPSP